MKRRNFLKLIAVSPAIPSVLCAKENLRYGRCVRLISTHGVWKGRFYIEQNILGVWVRGEPYSSDNNKNFSIQFDCPHEIRIKKYIREGNFNIRLV